MTTTQADLPRLGSYIGSTWVTDGGVSVTVNPARPREPIAELVSGDESVALAAIDAAAGAARGWARSSGAERQRVLLAAAAALDERAGTIGRDMAREMGKTLAESIGETRRAAQVIRYYAGQALEPDGETYPNPSPTTLLYARRVPIGVVTAITPWNFPIAIPAWKIAPALVYGNPVVWKPSELVPMTSVHLMTAFIDAGLPPGVLNLVLGPGRAVGAPLVAHEQVRAVTFTGSNAVGSALLMTATAHGKRVQLELGGKNPAVVLADADLDHAAASIARAAFLTAGQKCTATSRVIVERSSAEEFGARLAAAGDAMTMGDPLDPAVHLGPLASAAQYEKVSRYLGIGRHDGRTLTTRAHHPDEWGGYFVAPTVFADLDDGSAVIQEEVFGPVIALSVADSYEACVELANRTPFGLSASIYTASLDKALRFAEDSETGLVKINQETSGVEFTAPFGGHKASGFGAQEQGHAAREFFTHWRSVYLDRVR